MTQNAKRGFCHFFSLRPSRKEGGASSFYSSRHSAFTMIELIVVVAIFGILAAIITPRINSPLSDPPKRTLQRALTEAVDMAKNGASVRFRIDKEDNIGAVVPEVLVREEGSEIEKRAEGTWKAFQMQWAPEGKTWVFEPEMIYFSQDGTCTPAKISCGTPPYVENFLLTVTGYLVENNLF